MTTVNPPTPEDAADSGTPPETGPALELQVRHSRPDSMVLAASGDVDEATVASFEEMLAPQLVAALRTVVIDLSEVEFLGVCGLQLLSQSHLRARDRGIALRVVATSHEIVHALHVGGLNPLLGSYPTVAEALAAEGAP